MLFRSKPAIVAHGSELAGPDAFLTRDLRRPAAAPEPATATGKAHAFLNVCRHRGTRLVGEAGGCRRRFTCPYHAWTYDNRGALKGIPHGEAGFPGRRQGRPGPEAPRLRGVSRLDLGIGRVRCRAGYRRLPRRYGGGFRLARRRGLQGSSTRRRGRRAANWKILFEGGLESYHFRIAHKDTIGPFFQDNLSSYRTFGPHIRSILPRARLEGRDGAAGG